MKKATPKGMRGSTPTFTTGQTGARVRGPRDGAGSAAVPSPFASRPGTAVAAHTRSRIAIAGGSSIAPAVYLTAVATPIAAAAPTQYQTPPRSQPSAISASATATGASVTASFSANLP